MKKHVQGFSVLFLFLIFTSAFQAFGQNIQISGKVTDASTGQTLPGVSILVKNTTVGTTTGLNGKYSLQAKIGSKLVFSYIGYQTQTIVVSQKTIDVTMKPTATGLNELVVVGYTTERKSDITGAVSVVKVGKIISQPVSGIDKMLQGRAAGVDVISSGAPGGGVAVRIRGFSTIRNDDPLYIIDGVPTTSGINLLNPYDIKSIQILKGAAAASIYGSRAANGVIIITTKEGNSRKPRISFNAYTGIQSAFHLPHMLSAQEYGDAYWQASENDGITHVTNAIYGSGPSPVIPSFINTDGKQTIPSANTDWLKVIFKPAVVQSYDLSVSQGTEKKRSFFALSYFNRQGILKYTNFKRITTRINSDYMLFDKIKIGENLLASFSGSTKTETNSELNSVVYDAYKMLSIAPVYDINGNFTGNPLSDIENPLGKLYRNRNNVQKTYNLFGNLYSQYELTHGLIAKTSLGFDVSIFNFDNFNPSFQEPDAQNAVSELNVTNRTNINWVWTNTLNYVKTFAGKNSLNVLLGTEAINNSMRFTTAYRNNFPLDNLNSQVLNFGNGNSQRNSGDKFENSLVSYFGKVNYSFKNKYLFSATLRRDGTSKLKNYKWGTFPAFSVGWRISQEGFFHSNFINNLKFRFGWGQTGNQSIPPYVTVASYSSNPYYSNYAITGSQNSVTQGYTLTGNPNPNLKWETTTQTDVGFDLGLMKNRITITADYFIKKTKNLLFNRSLPPVVGGTNVTMWDNVGSMENKGFEFNMNYKNDPSKNFKFSVMLNVSVLRNKLTSLRQGIDFIGINPAILHIVNFDQETSRTVVGEPIASFYGYTVIGIFQSQAAADADKAQPNAVAGDFKFKDLNHDGIINDKDKSIIGSPLPKFTYSLSFNSQYKNFDASVFFIGSQGNKIYDLARYYTDFFDLSDYNKSERTLNAWTPENKNTNVPRLSMNDPNHNDRPSTYFIHKASYLILKTLQIGYTFPKRISMKIKVKRLRIYLEATNLFTITPYSGLSPEVGLQNYTSDNRNLDIGVDRGIYPPSRTFTFGVNFNL